MSTPFPLEEEAQTDTRGESLANPNAPRAPGTWGGWGFTENELPAGADVDRINALGEGNLPIIYRGLTALGAAAANVEQLGGAAAHGVGRFLRTGTPGPVTQELAEGATSIGQKIDADARRRLQALTPDPATSGAALQTIHGLVRVGAEALMPAGAAVAGGAEGYNRFRDLREQGVDESTAAESAAVTGLVNAAGVRVPMSFGSTLATRLASGAAANTAFGMIDRKADSAILRAGGYDEMADQEHTFDMAQIAIDAITGAAFGGVAHLHAADAHLDAALTANLTLRNRKAGPGVAVDPAAAGAHADALTKAIQDMQDGRHVDVAGTGVEDSAFLARGGEENPEVSDIIRSAFADSGLLEETDRVRQLEDALTTRMAGGNTRAHEIPRDSSLRGDQAAIEGRFAEQIGGDFDKARKDYEALPDTQGGKVMSVDSARELSPDYLLDRTQSSAVHEPASWLIKQLFAERLKRGPSAGEKAQVLFMAGGTGAGKTSAVARALGPEASRSQLIYDTNMNGYESSLKKVNQALEAGKKVKIAYVYRDPIVALSEGALPRAMRQEAKYGTGRTVPISEHLATHLGARDTMERLARHFEGDKRVEIVALDNSGEAGTARHVRLESIPKFADQAYNKLREQALQTLDRSRAEGRISEAVHRGFIGGPAAGGRGPRGNAGLGAGPGGQSQQQRQGGRPDELAARRQSPVHVPPRPEGPQKPSFGKIPPVDPARMSLAEAIAVTKAGEKHGLSLEEAEAQGLDPADLKARFGSRPVFTKGGASFDAMAEALGQHDYPVKDENGNPTPNALLDSLDRELRGTKQYAPAAGDYLSAVAAHEEGSARADQLSPTQDLDSELEQDAQMVAARQDAVNQALADRPDLRIVSDDGHEMSAQAAVDEAGDEVRRASADAPAMFKAAVDCFLRGAA